MNVLSLQAAWFTQISTPCYLKFTKYTASLWFSLIRLIWWWFQLIKVIVYSTPSSDEGWLFAEVPILKKKKNRNQIKYFTSEVSIFIDLIAWSEYSCPSTCSHNQTVFFPLQNLVQELELPYDRLHCWRMFISFQSCSFPLWGRFEINLIHVKIRFCMILYAGFQICNILSTWTNYIELKTTMGNQQVGRKGIKKQIEYILCFLRKGKCIHLLEKIIC